MSSPLAAGVKGPQPGLLDLEKELVCSICTETLYQPLTLLDCLHTFCGSCLKEWFTFEYNKARSASSSRSNPYTCPTCRAPVKDARHNATVTTLLDMFLTANPNRERSEVDKADIAKTYNPGESILPKIEHGAGRRSRRREEEDRAEEADRRQLEEARERSIREMRGTAAQVGARLEAPASDATGSRSRSQESRGQRREERRERRRRAEAAEAQLRDREAASSTITSASRAGLTTENLTAARLSSPTNSPRHPSAVEARQREHQIVPQTSLRSLMSSSESGTGTGDSVEAEQILQQIIEEGLLEGIDLRDLNPAQEDALSERIAEIYRQRHRSRDVQSSHPVSRDGRTTQRTRVRERQQEAERRHHQRSHSAHNLSTTGSTQVTSSADRRDPASGTRTRNVDTSSTTERRRALENEPRPVSPTPPSGGTRPEDSARNATRSAMDLSDRPQTSDNQRPARPRHSSDTRRTYTEPDQDESTRERWHRASHTDKARSSATEIQQPDSHAQRQPDGGTASASTTLAQSPRSRDAVVSSDLPVGPPRTVTQSTITSPSTVSIAPPRPQTETSRHLVQQPSEPSISCAICSRPKIQYDLHKHCSDCSSNICLRCYRTVPNSILGCQPDLKADSALGKSAPLSPSKGPVHAFSSRRYIRPGNTETVPESHPSHPATSAPGNGDPASRLQEGKFCDICHSFANTCYWSCDTCNKGDWGFCNPCINSHHGCTHPLLPLAHKSYAPKTPTLQQGPNPDSGVITLIPSNLHADVLPTTSSPRSRPSTSSSSGAGPTTTTDYVPLTFTTNCDICTYPIPPSHTRFHCPSHPSPSDLNPNPTANSNGTVGDYDICTNCYLNLVKVRKIRKEDGPNGWRRCPQGHRMIVIGFEDGPEGQKRIVVNDLVGGHSLRDVESGPGAPTQRSGNHHAPGHWTWVEDVDGGAIKTGSRVSRVRAATTITTTTTGPVPGSAGGAAGSTGNAAPPPSTSSNKFPPDGGNGLRAVAGYPWFPEEGEPGAGELMFPIWAEIREVEDVNGEWWAGVYAGAQGVFPGSCVRVISEFS